MKEIKICLVYLRKSMIFYACVMALFFLITIQTGSATIFLQNGTYISGDKLGEFVKVSDNISSSPVSIQFFYNTHCGSCQESIDYLNEFTKNNSYIAVQYHDLFNSSENVTVYNQYKEKFNNNTDIHYPVIFIGDIGISGSNDIVKYTGSVSERYLKKKDANLLTGFLSWITSLNNKI